MTSKKRVTFKEAVDVDDEEGGDVKVRKLADVRYDHEYLEDDYYCKIYYFHLKFPIFI